jgi:hypothetical protein
LQMQDSPVVAQKQLRRDETAFRYLLTIAARRISMDFAHAVATGNCEYNPIRDAKVLGRTLGPGDTKSYTREEMENVISALVDRGDAQLVMAAMCLVTQQPALPSNTINPCCRKMRCEA